MLHHFDIHIHSWYSADAADPPERLIEAAQAAGLSGIAITDHDNCNAHHYLKESGLIDSNGRMADGFLIIPGIEISTAEGHLLCIGALLEGLRHVPVKEVVGEVHAAGGLAIPAHPFDRWRAGIKKELLDQMADEGTIDAIEVFNAAVTSRSYNRKAKSYAENRNLPMTAGSDAHHSSAVGYARIAMEIEELSVPAVLQGLKGPSVLQERYLSRSEGLKKHFGNWFRATNARPPKRIPEK